MNKILIVLGVLVVVGGAAFVVIKSTTSTYQAKETQVPEVTVEEPATSESQETVNDESSLTEQAPTDQVGPVESIGTSVQNREIKAYHFGNGDSEVLFVAGLHGGYSWNTSALAYDLIDYLKKNPSAVPATVRVTVIPAVNPDGLYKVTGTEGPFLATNVKGNDEQKVAARFNAHGVDLNRNFNCLWEETGTWQNRSVSGGTAPFSEPESAAVRNYIEAHNPAAVVVYYAAAGGVYASNCKNGVLPETLKLTNVYAQASGYPANEEFDFYEITGDMVNWLAAKKVPAISVLLTTREDAEWNKNKKGVEAVLNYIAQ